MKLVNDIIALFKENPLLLIGVGAALLFFMKDNSGTRWFSLVMNKVKSATKGFASASAESPVSDCFRTPEGRVTMMVKLYQHCLAVGDTSAADGVKASLEALMKDSSNQSAPTKFY